MDTVVIAGRWSVEFLESNPDDASAGLRATLDGLARVRRVIVLGPTRKMRDEVPRCLSAGDLAACAITRREFDASNRFGDARIRALVAAHRNAEYVAPGDWLCDAASCPAVKGGVALYWDRTTSVPHAARQFTAEMVRWLRYTRKAESGKPITLPAPLFIAAACALMRGRMRAK
jgi:hypothetical protein